MYLQKEMAVFPIINLENINDDGRAKILEQIEDACQNWGFFEVIFHRLIILSLWSLSLSLLSLFLWGDVLIWF